VNNRNLKTFDVDIDTSVRLRRAFHKNNIFVAESGIQSKGDLDYLKDNNINVFLIGESLMRGNF
jgi:indole-3-glycerol phosphate synthase